MHFIIRFSFKNFVEGLSAGSTVYSIAYSEGSSDKAEAVVLLTSDGGIADGPINALRLTFEVNGVDALEVATGAAAKLKELIGLWGMIWSQGALLTEGLNESLREYSGGPPHPIKRLDEWIATKKGDEKEAVG
ncbi:MAG TPA: hypothetical protein VNO50_20565 [Pyrinomonadaceae bacterium]|nr:hypothetical protein [Pyrinomonadaceae bacterium]